MTIPSECKFTKEHEWIRKEGEEFVVGISEYAQNELGDVVFVDLPEVGKEVKKGDGFCNVESVKAVSDVYAPIDGTVVACNDALVDSPELLNSAPYADGWIVRIQASNPAQLEELQSAAEYESFITALSK